VSRQPIPSDSQQNSRVQSFQAVDQGAPGSKRVFTTNAAKSEAPPETSPDELAALRAFFELLSQWDQSAKRETQHE